MNKKLNYFTAIKFLSKYIGKHKKNFILFYIGWLFNALLKVYIPIMFAIMIDEIVYFRNVDTFLSVSLIFIIMLLFSCALYYFSDTQHCYLSILYAFDIRKDTFDNLQVADAEYMSNANTGDVINTVHKYAEECMHFVIRNVIHMFNNSFLLILFIVYVFLLGWQIGLLMMIIVPLSVFVSIKFGKKTKEYASEQRKNYAEYGGWLYEILSGIRDIRMLGAQETANHSFVKHQKKIINVNVKTGFLSMTAQNLITVINLLIQLSIFGVVAYMAYQNNMTVGTLTLILAYFASMTQYVGFLSGMYLEAQNRISYIQWIYDFMNIPTEKKWSGKNALAVTEGKITFNNIDFSYKGGNPVLSEFSLKINANEKIALVGKSGSGKTTLAYMLLGFYKPQNGFIEIDGQRLDECTLASIRENIGVVQQETLLFDGSIKENLLLGKRQATNAEVIAACEKAGIIDYINSLPEGIDTIIGMEGVGLSGGQKQRLAIARIYLRDPKIIIFDEATSSLDAETELNIHKAWEDVLVSRTSIIIAHRQNSIMLCQKAAILENGHIIEVGSPEVMLNASEAFKTLFAVKEADQHA